MMEKNYIKVGALNQYIKMLLDDNTFLHKVYLKGEISNFKHHMSGHYYFTLKDEEARISAIMFKNNTYQLKFTPEDGKKVLVEGRVSCYPAQGTYQIYVEKMEEDGLGNLYILYEELKKKLEKEGLFSSSHKKPIPKYPGRIGIVTAPTGAAIRDILSTIKRRFPICETILFPALVQGVNAASDIARQINAAQDYDLDLLIVGRGGGSIEDLWAFNEEVVARAIYDSKVPIISAVGHEIDYTISDFVADLRAPTPTGAAEMAVPMQEDVKLFLAQQKNILTIDIKKRMQILEGQILKYKDSYVLQQPERLYEIKMQKLDFVAEEIRRWWNEFLKGKKVQLEQLSSAYILKNPLLLYQKSEEKLLSYKSTIENSIEYLLKQKRHDMDLMVNTLKLINPLNILEKGYSLVKKDGKVIKTSKDLSQNDKIHITMKEGSVVALVKEIN